MSPCPNSLLDTPRPHPTPCPSGRHPSRLTPCPFSPALSPTAHWSHDTGPESLLPLQPLLQLLSVRNATPPLQGTPPLILGMRAGPVPPTLRTLPGLPVTLKRKSKLPCQLVPTLPGTRVAFLADPREAVTRNTWRNRAIQGKGGGIWKGYDPPGGVTARTLAKRQKAPYGQTKLQVLPTGHSLNYLLKIKHIKANKKLFRKRLGAGNL